MKLFRYHGKHERKKAPRLPLSAYLSYLLVATFLFTGVSFSKFATTASGSDRARVAGFRVTVSGQQASAEDIELSVGDESSSGTYTFTVNNGSEVTVRYQLILENLPAGVVAVVSDGNALSTFRTLAPQNQEELTLTFTAAVDATAVDDQTVTVRVYAEQVD